MEIQKKLEVRDIYIGKPDAKDEIISQSSDEFFKSFVIPQSFDYNELISGDKMFISGFKGTGKTALLLFLNNECLKVDNQTCSSFMLFKSDYNNIQRMNLENVSNNIIKTIDIQKDTLETEQDFEYIWRWILFKQIIDDNTRQHGGIFIEDKNWINFIETINKISADKSSSRFLKLPNKLKLGMHYISQPTGVQTVTPEIELDFNSKDNLKEYSHFVSLIDEATELFSCLSRKDIPYYLFIDELEAFYSEKVTLQRDLKMIRDMIITVKFMNDLIKKSNFNNIKFICSIRTEIINSICHYISPKEINKVISGYSCPLTWSYDNNNSYAHPIFEIWLKRIELSENKIGIQFKNYKEIYDKWFCPELHNTPTVTYILNNTWNKPRDIVRFLNATKNTQHSRRTLYTPGIFNECVSEYSEESLKELKEELNALYTPEEIKEIFMCLTGFKPIFSYDELIKRIEKYFKISFLNEKINSVLNDLYRVGIIGNNSLSSNISRWEYKGNQGIIFDEEWEIVIHRALWKTLSLSEKHGRIATIIEKNNSIDLYGTFVEAVVHKVVLGFAIVTFHVDGEKYNGSIYVNNLSEKRIKNIFDFVKPGDVLNASVLTYNSKHLKWNLTCLDM